MADFDEVMKATTRVRKLLALAAGNQNQAEATSAMAMVRRLADRYDIDIHKLTPYVELTDGEKLRHGAGLMREFAGRFKKDFPVADAKDYLEADLKKKDVFGAWDKEDE